MENGPFTDDFPIKTTIYRGFSMAMLNNQMVSMHFGNSIRSSNRLAHPKKTSGVVHKKIQGAHHPHSLDPDVETWSRWNGPWTWWVFSMFKHRRRSKYDYAIMLYLYHEKPDCNLDHGSYISSYVLNPTSTGRSLAFFGRSTRPQGPWQVPGRPR